jgi:phosphate transport system protein
MGSMVEKAVSRSIEALKERDLAKARRIIEDDKKVNERRFTIEEKCVELIATQQPMAGDLRAIICVLSIITEIERIGDHAEGIAKIVLMIGDEPPLKPLIDIPRMAEKVNGMLHRSLDALINHDADAAKHIVAEDDDVDNLYDQVFRELLTFMVEDPKTITRATRLVWVAHNLERSADRVTNICERVVYMVTGKMEEMEISKY